MNINPQTNFNQMVALCDYIQKASIELASNEGDWDKLSDIFDSFYEYVQSNVDKNSQIDNGFALTHEDGIRISIGVCVILEDVNESDYL